MSTADYVFSILMGLLLVVALSVMAFMVALANDFDPRTDHILPQRHATEVSR